ncbi:MAG: hypothetical protein GEV08_20085, partial [Acidimicrobiia bacterium]|nr:hypothetical protein [Acidimicrobiia bacterium]
MRLHAALAGVSLVGRAARRLVGGPPSPPLDRRAGAAVLAGAALLPFVARLAPLAAAAVWALGAARQRRQRSAERAGLVGELAEALPLLQLAVAGGLTVRAAVAA